MDYKMLWHSGKRSPMGIYTNRKVSFLFTQQGRYKLYIFISISVNNCKLGQIIHEISPYTKYSRYNSKPLDDHKNRCWLDEERKSLTEYTLLHIIDERSNNVSENNTMKCFPRRTNIYKNYQASTILLQVKQ